MAALCLATVLPAQARSGVLQCVPYARAVSGVEIYGNAHTWWNQAAGKYARGAEPRVGAVMSFRAIASMPLGHVAMVSKIVSDREVLLRHANWSRPGGIEIDVRAVDVSPAGDWSQVRVWYGPIGGLGRTAYPLNGFIYPDGDNGADSWQGQIAGGKRQVVASLELDLSDLVPEKLDL
ncbi:CHAP domain-containing protein [Sphingomonas canadensis]|uniref:CHAP domain-containing protein n=1 Tax=Sphingomonas canadensis TaxID=1219257 RepID=A0ABW3HAU6_9SPHN|nr:CHAP domain-containing protein [Sphingomonas canadensis]MCW3836458.1 CHAP domain-containing protein [Sphingomonas canadensis]